MMPAAMVLASVVVGVDLVVVLAAGVVPVVGVDAEDAGILVGILAGLAAGIHAGTRAGTLVGIHAGILAGILAGVVSVDGAALAASVVDAVALAASVGVGNHHL